MRLRLAANEITARRQRDYGSSSTRLRLVITMLLMMALGTTGIWAQTDYSGVYYIGAPDWVSGNTSTNYYLCPTEDWCYYQASNDITSTNNGQPFLTTYQCQNGVYDANKAIWIIERYGETNYYYIKHAIDGKYLTTNGQIKTSTNDTRMRVHLEATTTPTDNALFKITLISSYYEIVSKTAEDAGQTKKWVNLTHKNILSLQGEAVSGKGSDGPTGYKNVGGTIGFWYQPGAQTPNCKWYLESTPLPPTITVTDEGNVQMSMASGYESAYDIYYTTDGSTPDPSDIGDGKPTKDYSGTLYHDDIKDYTGSAIKAVAKRKSDNAVSNVVSLPLVTYNYKIVNLSDAIAAQYSIKEVPGKALSGYSTIPDAIKSTYISDETITFKSFDGDFSAAALESADKITETPTTSNIYITYTTTHLSNKFLHLQGVRTFNIKDSSSQFVYDDGTDTSVDYDSSGDATKAEKKYVWYFTGLDPYAVKVQNVGSKNYLTYTSSTLGLADSNSPQTYIIKNSEPLNSDPANPDATGTITLQSTDGNVVFSVTPVKLPLSYTLIDRAGKLIESNITYTGTWGLPAGWQSPVADYKYYKAATIVGDTYTFSEDDRIYGIDGATDNVVYVTYDVKNDIDITGSKTYLMKFSDGAEDFYPEDGDNGVDDKAIKATYPYNNGDFNLYIQGADEWTDQLSKSANTRTRWLWYIISNHNGTDLTGDAVDPYHVIIKSRQNQVYKLGDDSYDGNAYLYTYKPNNDVGVVTGVITQHDVVKAFDPTLKPTEYMLLGTNVKNMMLKSVDKIDGEQQTVNKFEQYWKNYPTVENYPIDNNGHKVGSNPAADNSTLRGLGWHRYQAWAYAEPWGGGTKVLEKGNHWFQTVSMGSGTFSLEEVALEPEVILLDQHGWEVMRVPVSQTAKLKQYDSPMVEEYQWYPKANKVSGYHKYKIPTEEAKRKIDIYENSENPANNYIKEWHVVRSVSYTSTSLSKTPEGYVEGYAAQDKKYKTDFYVTYTVKSDYAGTYVGAATEGETKASSFFVKQGGKYAQNSSNSIVLVNKPSLTDDIPTNVQWKVKPNFYIDHEMGYKYLGETGAQPDAESREDMETDYNAAGKNGFDPYNVQIQSVSNTARYFTANTTSTALDHGIWRGTGSTTVSLKEMSVGHISAEGYDHTTLDITNATFMVIDDGNGNMRLMPRFDNTKVMTSFTGLSDQSSAAAAGNNGEGTQSLVIEMVPTVVSSTDDIISMKGYYILNEGFDLKTSIGTSSAPFEGTIDGQLFHQTFDRPLVLYANNATIRNVILTNATLSSGNDDHHLGAIACTAKGNSRIYNCGILAGSLNESGHVGGIVGHLQDYSRVINCYSYANVTSGSEVGGIVGYNDYTSTAKELRTMVMNCAFYGDITGGTNAAPVYGGYNIANTKDGLNNYNYYSYDQATTFRNRTENATKKYNTALAVADDDFKRFEFYRLLLNSNKRLAAYYATGSSANDDQMAKWVLETADRSITSPAMPKVYPVLKAQDYYPSIINFDVENAPDSASVGRNHGGKLGKTLTVHLSGTGITTTSLTIDRTDKDFDRYNFNYDKIQLPFFNDVGTGNYTNNQVVTGWEITSMTGGTAGKYETGDKWNGYNFADRNCTNKDLFGTSGRIFSQGAYFDVPYGVTDIYIQPHWATAAYVADEYLDVVYSSDYSSQNVTTLGKQFPSQKIIINGSEQVVHKTISSAISSFSKGSVYDYAVVLVGNLHQSDVPLNDDSKRFTIMSVDLDNDHEPDYSMIYHHTKRMRVCPIRFDFLNVIGTAFAQKPNGASLLKNTTIFKTSGWFEVTNTALMYSNQMEYENTEGNSKENAPLILLGGKFDQFVSTQSSDVNGKTIYIHVGSNVWIDQFGLGTHSDGKKSTPHVPVSVTGGEYKGFYLTGTYNQDAAVRTDDAECYISGGHFVEAAGASQEAINGNVRWQIYNADIDAFYGGGVNAARPIKGTVTTEIFNSYVTTFCGGPKFGDMQTGKDVRTTATGCVFEKYFGAGYGGTSYSRKKYHDQTSYNFTNLAKYYSPNDRGRYFDGATTNSRDGGTGNDQYGKKGVGVATDFDYEFFVWSSGQTGARFFVKFASFSLANCIDVYSTLNNCTINQNFYGGGSFGSVSGTATSVLNGCTVHGNVFGGGFSATREKVPVRNSGFTKIPKYNSGSGMFESGTFSDTTEYEWKQHALPANGDIGIEDDGDKHYLYTDVDLDQLGKVGNTVLTIQGETVVEGKIFQYDDNGQVVKDGSGNNVVLETSGGVFGGGDMSAVNHDTQVTIEETVVNEVHKKPVVLNVFGGGNTADVLENTTVTITGGTIGSLAAASDTNGNVYGGGKGASTVVGGNVVVNLGTKTGEEAPYTYTGDGLVKHNLYGGSALGSVNTTPNASSVYDKTTAVNIYKGTVNGSVFGGGLGHDDADAAKDIVAKNYGNTTVTVENSNKDNALVKTAVYGGANENGVVKAKTTVTITGGTIGTAPQTATNIANTVFGGGFGQPTLVEGDVEITIGTSAAEPVNTNPIIYGSVYGGSALGGVNVNEAGDDQTSKAVAVNLYGGTINGNVFGGGLGQKNGVNEATIDIAARVGGSVNVLLDGAKLDTKFLGTKTESNDDRTFVSGQIFGCNNLNGSPKGHVKVHVKRTMGSEKSDTTPRDSRTTYDVAAVYGGGNKANYEPTDALITLPAPEAEDYTEKLNKKNKACAEVLIEGCDKTSIEYVYGGGNAAAVPATDVTILGDYIINYVFGGGNGKSTTDAPNNPGADVGINNQTEYAANPADGTYGSGKAVTKLVGGHIMYVFGGSNTKGNVRGGTSVSMPDNTSYTEEGYNYCDVRDIKEIYGAGNEAEQDGAVTMIVGCVDNMDYVYGGARNAHVKGGVDLIVTSGHFKGVYGGNDQSGTIQGPITVTIEETGCKPLVIDNLYLGGNDAAYSVYGYYSDAEDGNKLKPRISLTDHTATAIDAPTTPYSSAQWYADPVLNIVSCTRIGKESGVDLGGAFGGGYGAGATMYGSPTVNINMIPGDYAADVDSDGDGVNDSKALGVIRNVYGGGEQANVVGNTAVNICTAETVTVRSKKGAPVTNEPTAVHGALITENVFGAGKGLESDVNSAIVTGNTTIVMAGGSVAKSVYGGGELSQVGGNTTITVRGGEIGDHTGAKAGEKYGNVYGGGMGNTTNVRSGLVKGNTNITIENRVADEDYHTAHPETAVGTILSSPSIYHNIYGGGAHGSVGTYTYASEAAGAAISGYTSGGAASITITGGTIGVNGHDNGMVYGASRGDVGAPESIYDNVAWGYSTNVVIGTSGQGSNHTSPYIKGSVYGGGENGHVYQNASVAIHSGLIGITDTAIDGGAAYAYRGNVYGAGCGTDKYWVDANSDNVKDENEMHYNPKSGYVRGTASVLIDGGHVVRDVYGAGSMGSVDGSTIVTIAGNAEIGAEGSGGGYVFAAGRGDHDFPTMATVGSSNLNIQGGTIWMDAYGGGQNGAVTGAVSVSMTGGIVKRDVYGGGALAKTNTSYASGAAPATTVTLAGTTIEGKLYGGGLGQQAAAGVAAVYTAVANGTTLTSGKTYYTSNTGTGEFVSDGTEASDGTNYFTLTTPAVAAVEAVAADVNGPVTVSVTSGEVVNVFGCNNINGAPQSTVEVNISGGTVTNNVYGGGNQAAYMYADKDKPLKVKVSGGTVNNDVYGGGLSAEVAGSIEVTVSGGKIVNDVYGGGALAETNTANWVKGNRTVYLQVTDISYPTYVKRDIADGATIPANYYTYDSSTKEYVSASGTAQTGTDYYELVDGASVVGLYTKNSSDEYVAAAGTAQTGTYYYEKRDLPGNWNPEGHPQYTKVTLTGGIVGNVFGGGLGQQAVGTEGTPGYVPAVAANVYGDITVTVNKSADIDAIGGSGAAFTFKHEDVTLGGKTYYSVPLTGRVFGCNNLNGSPLGNVKVEIYSTRQIDALGNRMPGHGPNSTNGYDMQAVYGGGRQANYVPAENMKSEVNIYGCDETSISRVYGGGYSASVPSTNVTIWGSYDIEYAFGGGNGGLPIIKNGAWIVNDGADVNGAANITCHGGKIGQVFGGSDFKGDCRSSNPKLDQQGSCPLKITKFYGAGSEATVNGDVNVVLAACSEENSMIEYVCGGSYKAFINGNVTLTITSGFFNNVYGGNDERGGIKGNIVVNIEETDPCIKPIIIKNLVGGGNNAAFPGTYENGSDIESGGANQHTITVNVKSATRIDNVYGGCFNAEAKANTEVNINMLHGDEAKGELRPLPSDYGTRANIPSNIINVTTSYDPTIPVKDASVVGYYTDASGTTPATGTADGSTTYYEKRVTGTIKAEIGTIGNVFGGGKQGKVTGNTTVNIGTELTVPIMKRNEAGVIDAEIVNGQYTNIKWDNKDVLGAHIDGNVYGGGELADVTGNTTVNIRAKKNGSGDYEAVADNGEKVTIGGNVFGGGKGEDDSFTCAKAMVGVVDTDNGSTNVVIGNGTISGNVYGGGEVGRVEKDTEVTIGLTPATGVASSAPVITGSVFGAGQGVKTHGYSALVRGNSTVTIQSNAKVKKNVYGGGEIGTVGKYWVTGVPYTETPPPVPTGTGNGMPYATRSGGECTVIVQGEAQIGPDDGPATETAGHVFGGGMGVEATYNNEEPNRSKRMVTYDGSIYTIGGIGNKWDYYEADKNFVWEYFESKAKYLNFLQTLALVSDANVTITGNAKVKGNVYGGSQSGFLQRDTEVKITSSTVTIGTEGSYGNVFGGGKGLPKHGSGDGLEDFDEAGQVKGDAKVTISGGTIHGSVYGGGELGFVGKFNTTDHKNYTWSSYKTKDNVDVAESGKCEVNISGTTTVKGNVFGAGMGKDDTFECEQAMVRTTKVTISAGTVGTLDGSELKEGTGNVYGGGKVGRVDQNAEVTLGVENASGDAAPVIQGDVFGAGQGKETHGYSGLARGNTTVIVQGTTEVGKSVYGGGEVAAVGRYGLDSSGMPSTLVSGGNCEVTIRDHAQIGYIGGGNVYGASKGVYPAYSYSTSDLAHSCKRMTRYTNATDFPEADKNKTWSYTDATDYTYVWEYFDTKDKYLNFLQTLALTTDADLTIDEDATINGSVYGGSENGFVQRDTDVKIQGNSTIGTSSSVGHVFGGGKGVSGFDKAGRVRGNTKVAIGGSAAITGNVYGGGELGFVGLFKYTDDGKSYIWQKIRAKGADEGTTTYDTGASVVTITGGTIGSESISTANHASGHVFAAGKGEDKTFKCEPAIMRTASVIVSNGTVYGNVYGGGEISRVDEHTSVMIGFNHLANANTTYYQKETDTYSEATVTPGSSVVGYYIRSGQEGSYTYTLIQENEDPIINGSVFGAGAGVETHGYSALVRGNTTVTVEGKTKVKKNVYGGGEIAAVGKYSLDSNNMPTSLVSDNLGICTVTVRGDAEIGYGGADSNAGHLFGASKGVVPHYYLDVDSYATDAEKPKRMTIINGSDAWEYFDTKADYFKFLETLALTTQSIVTVDGHAKVKGNVYGGSENGFVQHHVSVTMNAGEIGTSGSYGDIYGGGKGFAGFDVAGRVSGDVTLTVNNGTMYGSVYGGGELGIVKQNVTVNINGGTISNNVYGGGALADTNTDNWADVFTEVTGLTVNTSDVTGLYELEGTHYFRTSDFKAASGKTYYRRGGTWAEGKTSASNTTTVSLNGGTIGHDAYGGALGQFAKDAEGTENDLQLIEPMVFGDILVELNKGKVAADKGCTVEKIFGCNDMCGTPKGHVTVHVYATQHTGKDNISQKIAPPTYSTVKSKDETYAKYLQRVIKVARPEPEGLVLSGLEESVIVAAETVYTTYKDKDDESLTTDEKTIITTAAKNVVKEIEKLHDYDVKAVYGGGDLAPYEPTSLEENTEVIIEGCEVTSIEQVYGGGNAASVPATDTKIESAFIIDQVYGGGNGLDGYSINGTHYENPGANVGYRNFTTVYKTGETGYTDVATNGDGTSAHPYKAIDNANASDKAGREANYLYGSGKANTTVTGGHIHTVYGGSNHRGNIRYEVLSKYQKSGECPLVTDETYGGSKDAETDGEIRVVLDCVEYGGTYFGGSQNANINNNVTIDITNGTFDRVFGGNNTAGTINGAITINIEEKGCSPIVIGELYGGGFLAPYSVYGYNEADTYDAEDESGNKIWVDPSDHAKGYIQQRKPYYPGETGALATPHRDPYINIISATEIRTIFGGGYKATVIGSPHVNVNMTKGMILEQYAKDMAGYSTLPEDEKDAGGNQILPIGTIGNIFGGGNQADVIGNTYVDIGTGVWRDRITGEEETITPARNAAFITGNVYGGGNMGHVGYFTVDEDDSNDIPNGKPISCTKYTGTCNVTVSNGDIGPDNMKMTAAGGPDNAGHVFGAGKGSNHPDYDNTAYVSYTNVTVNGTAWVKGDVFGGGEDGHVLHDTHVVIDGDCQIGNGHLLIKDGESTIIDRGLNRRFTNDEWTNGHLTVTDADFTTAELTETPTLVSIVNTQFANSLPECASWPYEAPYAPHDKFALYMDDAGKTYYDKEKTHDAEGGYMNATDGHTFYGNVFGGGSGYFPYEAGKWNMKAGMVEGNTTLEIKGGHILTSAYGGGELANVGDRTLTDGQGKSTVRMTGGTLGVPRTLAQIDAHPVTCYLFGAGKGDQIVDFNMDTNVREVDMEVTGGRIYGSVFGGGEDGHVLGNVNMTVGGDVYIGTWGTSYVDGNIFGGGRGFSGNAITAGSVGGNVTMNITGGTMLGSVYGGGRLASIGSYFVPDTHPKYGQLVPDGKNQSLALVNNDANNDPVVTAEGATHGHITINISGSPVIGNDREYVYVNADNAATIVGQGDIAKTEFSDFAPFTEKVKDEEGLITEASSSTTYRRLSHTKGGSVYGGSMGRIYMLDNTTPISNWDKLAHAKSTTVTISGNAIIKSSVFGGSELGQVEGNTVVNISGTPTLGTEVTEVFDEIPVTQYSFGAVYGGGYGSDLLLTSVANPRELAGKVGGSSTVNMSGGKVKASIYGGGKIATIGKNTVVNVSGGEIGLNKVRKNDGYVMYGGEAIGNVYGGGKGNLTYPLMGVVKGNTNVTVSGGSIYHNVYGGGALASVGTFDLSTEENKGTYYVPSAGYPVNWTPNTGTATVTITGGTIGISGRDNGMVNGSSRGNIENPNVYFTQEEINAATEGQPAYGKTTKDIKSTGIDRYDKVAWIKDAVVTIGEASGESTGPHIKGSVYGGGENGHNSGNATVTVNRGTIGVVDTEDPWYDFGNDEINKKALIARGNVYGAGCGTDMYDSDKDGKDDTHNPKAGVVLGNTTVNIVGGHIGHSVYGGGSMGSVGTVTSEEIHDNVDAGFALSWPYKFVYKGGTGKATVNVTGGHIGTLDLDGGDIFGGARGEAGDRYATAHLACVGETEVNVNYETPASESDIPNIKTNFTIPCVTGSVSGSGEDGYVYGDTYVTLNKGLIAHSLYGGGKGKGTYEVTLKKIGGAEGDTYPTKIYSLIAGRVMGNTYVTMNGGIVGRNVYGGGNMASVGKGNYASGTDDYYTGGYGEKIGSALWTSSTNGDNAWEFLNSGKTTVNVFGGQVGVKSTELKNNLPVGNVFGGSAGEAAPNVPKDLSPRYHYCPAFFSGYVNKTDVHIGGGYKCTAACTIGGKSYKVGDTLNDDQYNALTSDKDKWEAITTTPTILASVYGGGQDGHVRGDTKVTVNGGVIGLAYNSDNQGILGTSDLDSGQWLHRGNVYGAGSGISEYTSTFVYATGYTGDQIPKTGYSTSAGSVTCSTEVNIKGGTIHRNVYGGGSMGSVGAPPIPPGRTDLQDKKGDNTHGIGWQSQCTVNIGGAGQVTIGTNPGYNLSYGGEVYGASRGKSDLDATQYATTVWTKVNIQNGATIMGNVYGGGDNGMVKKDSEVKIGD